MLGFLYSDKNIMSPVTINGRKFLESGLPRYANNVPSSTRKCLFFSKFRRSLFLNAVWCQNSRQDGWRNRAGRRPRRFMPTVRLARPSGPAPAHGADGLPPAQGRHQPKPARASKAWKLRRTVSRRSGSDSPSTKRCSKFGCRNRSTTRPRAISTARLPAGR